MYQAELYVDFHTSGVLGEVTEEIGEPFEVLEEEVHEDGTITFVIQTRGYGEYLVERLSDAPEVYEIERLDGGTLLVQKEAKGATVAIRENHGKLSGVDKVNGTRRVFEVLLFRQQDLRAIIDDLRELGDVRLNSLVEKTGDADILSERQREAVRTALKMGFYEWPRTADATDVADALGVTHPTVLEHLRKAEGKLIARALDEDPDATRGAEEFLLS